MVGIPNPRHDERACEKCEQTYTPSSGVQRFCPACSPAVQRTQRQEKIRLFVVANGFDKPPCETTLEPRECQNPECKRTYWPTSSAQKFCPLCRTYRNKRHYRKSMTPRGRSCRWCLRRDNEASFKKSDECCGCTSRASLYGRCEKCKGRPMRKARKGFKYCPHCTTPPVRPSFYKVLLLFQGHQRAVYRSPRADVVYRGATQRLQAVAKKCGSSERAVLMVVDRRGFLLGQVRRPVLVAPDKRQLPWPHTLSALNTRQLGDLYDLAHFVYVGEASVLTFAWWWQKYRDGASQNTAARGWERLKKTFRDYGVQFTLVDPDTSQPVASTRTGGIKATLAIKFDDPLDFVTQVRRAMTARDPEDDDDEG